MKNDIQTGNFTNEELENISRFDRDNKDRIQLFDINKLYEPVFPKTFNKQVVNWIGNYYSVTIFASDSKMNANFGLVQKSYVDNYINRWMDFENTTGIIINSKEVY